MAFKSFVEEARKTNQKMAELGQSLNIQKQPRPQQGSNYTPSKAMIAAGADEIEMKLYPKRFTGNNLGELNNSTQKMIVPEKQEVVEEENEVEKPKMIGDDEVISTFSNKSKQVIDERHCNIIKNVVNSTGRTNYSAAGWEGCKHLKQDGSNCYCREYMSLCAKDRCKRTTR